MSTARQATEDLVDFKRGISALRQVCQEIGGVPVDEQSSSSEDIVLWASTTIERLTRERDEAREAARIMFFQVPSHYDKEYLARWPWLKETT